MSRGSRVVGGVVKRALAGRLVHPVALGTMNLAIEGRPSRGDAVRVIHGALDAGVEVIDTADAYALGADDVGYAEEIVREALASWPGARPLVATKGGVVRTGGGWAHDGRPEHLVRACDASLRALGVERIDLYQLHAVDERVPVEESVGALARLAEAGKVAAVGVSNVALDELERAVRAAGVGGIASVQNEASPYVARGLEDGVLARCGELGFAFLAYAPMGGWRAGRLAHEPVLREIGAEIDATPFEVVIAWLLGASEVLLPVAGASRCENAVSSARGAGLRLTAEQRERVGAGLAARAT